MKTLYSALRFLFELACIGAVGYWGFTRADWGGWRYALGIVAPLVLIAVWGIWMAPSSPHRLQGIVRLLVELGIYAIVALCIHNTDYAHLTIGFVALATINAVINHFTGWLI